MGDGAGVTSTVNEQLRSMVDDAGGVAHYTRVVSLVAVTDRLDAELTGPLRVQQRDPALSGGDSLVVEVPVNTEGQVPFGNCARDQHQLLIINGLFSELKGHYLGRD